MYQLTKDDIKAMRNADYVIFTRKNGNDYITCGKEESDEFGTMRRERIIEVDGRIVDYDFDTSFDTETAYCFHSNHTAKYNTYWQSVVSLLKVDDAVQLDWIRNNGSDFLRKHEIVMDMLDIKIIHKDGKSISLHLHTSVVGDICMFRMIRQYQ